jgi:RHS repeat-associated protein
MKRRSHGGWHCFLAAALHLLAPVCPASPRLPDHNGNVLTTTEGTNVLTRTVDQRDLVLSHTNAQSETIGYRYDASGNLVQLIYPGSKTVTYAYDNRERLSTITDWSSRVTTLTWDDAGRLVKVTRPNGTYRDYQYDAAGRMIQLAERKANKRGICVVRFELDAAGRPTKKLTLPVPQAVSGIPAVTATFDADNRMETLLGYGIPHDADGNMQAIFLPFGVYPVGELYWDTRNRLTDVWEQVWAGQFFLGYNQTQFAYDAEGNRTHKMFNGATTRYTVNPHGLNAMSEVLIEHKPDNTKRWYVWGGPAGLLYESQTNSSGTETAVRYYHSDQVGSTLALTDSSANVTGRVEYTPYGMITHAEGVIDTPYLFNGAFGVQTDAETGLIHMRARYYHPWLGRFLSEDPVQFSGGGNWYAFTSGDPIFGSDPSGLTERAAFNSIDWAQMPQSTTSWQNPDGSTNWGSWIAQGLAGVPGYVADNFWSSTQRNLSDPKFVMESMAGGFGAAGIRNGLARGTESFVAQGIPNVTEKGLVRIESHLGNLGALDDGANQAMLSRLRSGQTSTYDVNFYMHELKESARMKAGLEYDAAHKATLEWQGIPYGPATPAQLYHPDVIRQFSTEFNPATWP